MKRLIVNYVGTAYGLGAYLATIREVQERLNENGFYEEYRYDDYGRLVPAHER